MAVKEIADYSSETGKQNAESSLVTVVIFINIGIVFVNKSDAYALKIGRFDHAQFFGCIFFDIDKIVFSVKPLLQLIGFLLQIGELTFEIGNATVISVNLSIIHHEKQEKDRKSHDAENERHRERRFVFLAVIDDFPCLEASAAVSSCDRFSGR